MKRISVRRVASVIATAMAMTLVFATLGWAMMPQWNTRPYTKHIAIASADTTITPAHANIPHEGRYRTRETRLSIKTGDGVTLPAVLREPVDAPGPRPACLFIHGSGTSGAEDFGDIANAMASAGIVTLVPAKRNDNYTVLHRDYPRFAREYGRSLDVLRGISGVDPAKTGIYAESEGTWIATVLTQQHPDLAFAIPHLSPGRFGPSADDARSHQLSDRRGRTRCRQAAYSAHHQPWHTTHGTRLCGFRRGQIPQIAHHAATHQLWRQGHSHAGRTGRAAADQSRKPGWQYECDAAVL